MLNVRSKTCGEPLQAAVIFYDIIGQKKKASRLNLSNNLLSRNLNTCFFFYKHNTYKHIQPGISEKKLAYAKHTFQPGKSLFPSFFPVSNLIQRRIQNPVKHLR